MPAAREACLVLVAGLCLGACGDGGAEPGMGQLRIVSGSDQTDTSGVVLEEPLVVEVHEQGGSAAEGVTVRFGPAACRPGCAFPFSTQLGRVAPEVEVVTDARGRASTRVFLSFPAGDAGVPVEVPSLELADTAQFHIAPGNPVGILFRVPDTAVYVGASYELQAALVDRLLSPRSEAVTYHVETPSIVSVSAAGVLRAEAIGRGTVRATDGEFAAVAQVSPFEESAFPAFSADGDWVYFHGFTLASLGGEIWRVHGDGTGLERVGPPSGTESADVFPTPSPDGSRVAFFSSRGHAETSTLRILTLADSSEMELALDGTQPRWSPQGDWIAWERRDTLLGQGTVWVVRPDGTTAHRISGADIPLIDFGLSWSPDGQWLIAISQFGPVLLALDGTTLPLHLGGTPVYPAWKP